MSDKDQVDDLLDVVEGLDLIEEDLESQLEVNRQKQKELNNISAEAKMDSSLLALEAAKAAQDAASQSQEATHASLKLAEKMREHTEELSNANFNWRQSVRHAAKELEDSKKIFVTMMVITLILALAAIGLMGAVYYKLNNKQEQLKGEILDVIQTENALFKRDIAVKIDDLAAQIEASRFYVEKLASQGSADPMHNSEQTDAAEHKADVTDNSPHAETMHTDGAIHAVHSETETQHSAPEPTNTVNAEQLQADLDKQLSTHYQQLSEQITNIATQQSQLTQSLAKLQSNTVNKTHSETVEAQLNSKQSQQLADIRWLVSKHDKQLQQISDQIAELKTKPVTEDSKANDERLEQQFKTMQLQQKQIEVQLHKLQENLEQIMKKINEEKPYSYKAK